MLLEITDAQYLEDYRVKLTFNDGRDGIANLHPLITANPTSIFPTFADKTFVRLFSLEHGTLCWPGECDVAAEYLCFHAFQKDAGLQALFRQWGYLDENADALAA
ncbi:MAG: DUF2442 domain-containing protein [Gallionellaceae bacterium]